MLHGRKGKSESIHFPIKQGQCLQILRLLMCGTRRTYEQQQLKYINFHCVYFPSPRLASLHRIVDGLWVFINSDRVLFPPE